MALVDRDLQSFFCWTDYHFRSESPKRVTVYNIHRVNVEYKNGQSIECQLNESKHEGFQICR